MWVKREALSTRGTWPWWIVGIVGVLELLEGSNVYQLLLQRRILLRGWTYFRIPHRRIIHFANRLKQMNLQLCMSRFQLVIGREGLVGGVKKNKLQLSFPLIMVISMLSNIYTNVGYNINGVTLRFEALFILFWKIWFFSLSLLQKVWINNV